MTPDSTYDKGRQTTTKTKKNKQSVKYRHHGRGRVGGYVYMYDNVLKMQDNVDTEHRMCTHGDVWVAEKMKWIESMAWRPVKIYPCALRLDSKRNWRFVIYSL
ncbi:hypothetical protein CHS0354_013682 [Potamilus streckersoni]|uniref:Uncharacterized protein n=1 Tax=Potamilus streckersoni TaxID=2493646 RepID=A0AAE0SFR6_9BIVA|nr:hypothetical protein CHS0354_013682 [Potamilus streckersoni]